MLYVNNNEYFWSDIPKISSSKEKIVELDESLHKIGLQVIEGGHLNLGFSSYRTTFQLTAIREQRSLVSIMITYESEVEDSGIPSTINMSSFNFIRNLESYLLNDAT